MVFINIISISLVFNYNMQKCSFEGGCKGRVVWACKCTSPYLYFCDEHLLNHGRTPGEHHLECIIVELNRIQTKIVLPKLKDFIKYLKRCRKDVIDNAKILIECIENETRKSLNLIKELAKVSVDLISERSINKENYERIQCCTDLNHNYISDDVENIKLSIKNLYGSYNFEGIWKECTQVIFSRSDAGGLQAIDLNIFKLSNLDYAPKIGPHCNTCKVNQNTYFLHGGSINGGHRAEAYLINIKDENYEKLKNGPTQIMSGSALKNNKVYIFGGYTGNQETTACHTFDLKYKEWKSISALPQASRSITAAIIGDNIILSGIQFNCCYSYNDSTFTNILNLPYNEYKIVCEGWIYVTPVLYENQDRNFSKWISHNVISCNPFLWTYCVFKKNEFFYFFEQGNRLLRVNTKLKKLETIGFF